MILIAISGKKCSGKDTFAGYIMDLMGAQLPHIPVHKISFADALYEEVARGLLVQQGNCNPLPFELRVKVNYIKGHKDHFRLILQGWGTDYRRQLCGEDYWIQEWLKRVNRVEDNSVVLCCDCRFGNELAVCKTIGAYCIRINRILNYTDTHPSEKELDEVTTWDKVIKNDLYLDHLKLQAEKTILQILVHNKLIEPTALKT